jgi:hypothetical protein
MVELTIVEITQSCKLVFLTFWLVLKIGKALLQKFGSWVILGTTKAEDIFLSDSKDKSSQYWISSHR